MVTTIKTQLRSQFKVDCIATVGNLEMTVEPAVVGELLGSVLSCLGII